MMDLTFVLDSRFFKGFKNLKNMTSENFIINLDEIETKFGVMQVNKAISIHKINEKIWTDFKNKNQIKSNNNCCFLIPLKTNENDFLCSDDKQCEKKIYSLINSLNGIINKKKMIENYRILSDLDKINCEKTEEMRVFKQRIENLNNFHMENCKKLKKLDETIEDEDCIKDLTDDITQEIRLISKNDRKIMDAIDECIKSGKIKSNADALGGTYF